MFSIKPPFGAQPRSIVRVSGIFIQSDLSTGTNISSNQSSCIIDKLSITAVCHAGSRSHLTARHSVKSKRKWIKCRQHAGVSQRCCQHGHSALRCLLLTGAAFFLFVCFFHINSYSCLVFVFWSTGFCISNFCCLKATSFHLLLLGMNTALIFWDWPSPIHCLFCRI